MWLVEVAFFIEEVSVTILDATLLKDPSSSNRQIMISLGLNSVLTDTNGVRFIHRQGMVLILHVIFNHIFTQTQYLQGCYPDFLQVVSSLIADLTVFFKYYAV